MSDFAYDVFLSHSSKDKVVVRELAQRLKSDGVRVWLDEWEIKAGDNIPHKIEEGLENSRVLVLCISANAFGSDWAQLEAGTFRFRDPLNKQRRFIPLRLDDTPIKGSLSQFLYIKWRPHDREQEYAKLLDGCRNPNNWPRDSKGSRSTSQGNVVAEDTSHRQAPARTVSSLVQWAGLIFGLLMVLLVTYVAWEYGRVGPRSGPPPETTNNPSVTQNGNHDPAISFFIRELPGAKDRAHLIRAAWQSWEEVGSITGIEAKNEDLATVILEVGAVSAVKAIRPNDQGNISNKWVIRFSRSEEFDDRRLQALACHAFGRVLDLGFSDDPSDVMYDPDNTAVSRVLKPSANDIDNLRMRN
jgi:hypothetical protein